MSTQNIFTFSISESDDENLARVQRIKETCRKNGTSFSYIVLQALKLSDQHKKAAK